MDGHGGFNARGWEGSQRIYLLQGKQNKLSCVTGHGSWISVILCSTLADTARCVV